MIYTKTEKLWFTEVENVHADHERPFVEEGVPAQIISYNGKQTAIAAGTGTDEQWGGISFTQTLDPTSLPVVYDYPTSVYETVTRQLPNELSVGRRIGNPVVQVVTDRGLSTESFASLTLTAGTPADGEVKIEDYTIVLHANQQNSDLRLMGSKIPLYTEVLEISGDEQPGRSVHLKIAKIGLITEGKNVVTTCYTPGDWNVLSKVYMSGGKFTLDSNDATDISHYVRVAKAPTSTQQGLALRVTK